jgi:hypothetical protein
MQIQSSGVVIKLSNLILEISHVLKRFVGEFACCCSDCCDSLPVEGVEGLSGLLSSMFPSRFFSLELPFEELFLVRLPSTDEMSFGFGFGGVSLLQLVLVLFSFNIMMTMKRIMLPSLHNPTEVAKPLTLLSNKNF